MSDDKNPKAEDPKAELEDRLVKRSMEPYEKVLDDDEKEGMQLFMELFVKTHPVMRQMVDRRVKEAAAIKAAKRAASARPAPPAPVPPESGGERRDVDASGVVSKDGAPGAKDKAGGEP
jgi:hypothetical protein